MTLNGWQRLWVLLTAVYAIPVVVIAVGEVPVQEQIEAEWVFETIEVVRQPNQSTFQIRDAYRDLPNDEIVRRIHEKHKDATFTSQSFDKIDLDYQNKLNSLPSKQLEMLAVAFAFWACPVIGLYLLGFGIGWVRRGFKNT